MSAKGKVTGCSNVSAALRSDGLSIRLLTLLETKQSAVIEFSADTGNVFLSSLIAILLGYGAKSVEISFEEFLSALPAKQAASFKKALWESIILNQELVLEMGLQGKEWFVEGMPFKDERGRTRLTAVVTPRESDGRAEDWDRKVALNGATILAVDDNDDSLRLFKAIFDRHGARTLMAASAAEALETIKSERPDVIVSDLSMPDEDGFSLMESVRQLSPLGSGCVPAVAISGLSEDDYCERAVEAGFQCYISKPVDPDELVQTVAQLLARDSH